MGHHTVLYYAVWSVVETLRVFQTRGCFGNVLVFACLSHWPWYLLIEFWYWYLDPSDPPLIFDIPWTFAYVFVVATPILMAVSSFCHTGIVLTTRHLLKQYHKEHQQSQPGIVRCMKESLRKCFGALFWYYMIESVLLAAAVLLGLFLALFHRYILLAILLLAVAFTQFVLVLATPVLITTKETVSVWERLRRSAELVLNNTKYVAFSILCFGIFSTFPVILLLIMTRGYFFLRPLLILPVLWCLTSLWNIQRLVVYLHVHHRERRGSFTSVASDSSDALCTLRWMSSFEEPVCKKKRRKTRLVVLGFAIFVSMTSLTVCSRLVRVFSPAGSARTIYSKARRDRAGGQILEMLSYHAYARYQKINYGGSCLDTRLYNKTDEDSVATIRNVKMADDMFQSVGMHKICRRGCPPRGYRDKTHFVHSLLPFLMARTTMSKDWLNELHTHVTYPETTKNVYKIVAHIRRRDIVPCAGNRIHRYLPNSYYHEVIEQYTSSAPKDATVEVVIHTQKNFFEKLSDFRDRNYTIKIDKETEMTDVWKEMMTADVFIMSRSTFSVIPAILNKNIVVYPYFALFYKLPSWTMVDAGIQRRAKREVIRMEKEVCESLRFQRVGRSGVVHLLNYGILDWFDIK